MKNNIMLKMTEFSKYILKQYIKEGSIVIDGTMGNGNDTYFLADIVGEKGKVYSFDIQRQAIENTTKLLSNNKNIINRVELINDSHVNIEKHVKTKIDGATFNLGYLPNGEKNITTKVDTTIIAIEHCIDLLNKNGIISIVIYQGHDEGKEEKNTIYDFVSKLDKHIFHVLKIELANQDKNPPSMILITKKQ